MSTPDELSAMKIRADLETLIELLRSSYHPADSCLGALGRLAAAPAWSVRIEPGADEQCPICGPGSGCTAHCEEHGYWHCDRPEHERTAHEVQLQMLANQLREHEALVPADLREDGWTAADVLREFDHRDFATNSAGEGETAEERARIVALVQANPHLVSSPGHECKRVQAFVAAVNAGQQSSTRGCLDEPMRASGVQSPALLAAARAVVANDLQALVSGGAVLAIVERAREEGTTVLDAATELISRAETTSAGDHPGPAEGADPSGSVALNDRGASGRVEQIGPDPELRAHRSGGSTSAGEHSTSVCICAAGHRDATEDEKTFACREGEPCKYGKVNRRRWQVDEPVTVNGRDGTIVALVTDDHGACVHDPFLVIQFPTGNEGLWPEEVDPAIGEETP